MLFIKEIRNILIFSLILINKLLYASCNTSISDLSSNESISSFSDSEPESDPDLLSDFTKLNISNNYDDTTSDNSFTSDSTDQSCSSKQLSLLRNTENIFDYIILSLREIYQSTQDNLDTPYALEEAACINKFKNDYRKDEISTEYQNLLRYLYFFEENLRRIEDLICAKISLFQLEYSQTKRINKLDIQKETINIKNEIKKNIRNFKKIIKTILRKINKISILTDSEQKERIKTVNHYLSKIETIDIRIDRIKIATLSNYLYRTTACGNP